MDLFDLVAKLTLDKSDYDSGLDSAEKSASTTGSKLKNAFGVAAKAGAGLATGAVAAGAAIYGMATKSASTADHIDKMSQKLGISREAYQELDFITSQSGTSVDGLRAGMKTLTTQMTNAAEGSSTAVGAFEKLGVSIYDNNGNLKDQETMFWDTITALNNMESGTEKAALANELLGKSGSELQPMLNGAAGSIEEMREKAHDLGLVMSDETIDAGVKFTDTLDQVTRSLSVIGTEVGKEVMPIVQEALEFILEHMPEIQGVVSSVFGLLEKYVDWFVEAAKTYVLPTLEQIIDFVQNVFAGNWSAAWDNVKGIFTSAWEGITGFFSDTFNSVAEVIQSINWAEVGSNIWEWIKGAFTVTVEWLTGIFEKVKELLGEVEWAEIGTTIWGWIKEAFAVTVEWLTEVFEAAKELLGEIDWAQIGTTIWEFIKGAFSVTVEWLTELFETAKELLTEVDWAEIGSTIWTIIKGVFTVTTGWLKTIFNTAKERLAEVDWVGIGEKVWETIKGAFTVTTTWLRAILTTAKTTLAEVNWIEIGEAIWTTVKGAFTVTFEWLKSIFDAAITELVKIDWVEIGDAIWTIIKHAFSVTADWLGEIFENAKTTMREIEWSEIGDAIWKIIKHAFAVTGEWLTELRDNALEAIVDSEWFQVGEKIWEIIKSAFTGDLFDISNIHVPTPHFVATTFQVGPISLPDFTVEWYAKARKNPFMFSNATLFGAGESGDEILYGHNSLMEDIKGAVAEAGTDSRLYNLLAEYLPEILDRSSKEIVLDDGTLVGRMDTSLGWTASQYRRGA